VGIISSSRRVVQAFKTSKAATQKEKNYSLEHVYEQGAITEGAWMSFRTVHTTQLFGRIGQTSGVAT